jgi:uncharacterized phiE125 gp8 family phage protein
VSDLKLHARIAETVEDALLADLLDVAEDAAEQFTWRKFLTQTWDQYFDGFDDPLRLKYGDASSITSISYTDEDGDSQTLAATVYELGEEDGGPVVRRKYNQEWATTRAHEDVVVVRFVCGYGAATAVPQRVHQAIRVHAAWDYRNREGQAMPLPNTFYQLLRPFRLMRYQAIGEA